MIWTDELLRVTGRLHEARGPMQATLEMAISLNELRDAASRAEILSDLLLRIGAVKESVEYGLKSVGFADRSQDNDTWQKELSRTTLANALHQAGQLSEADKLFGEAENLRQEHSPDIFKNGAK